MPKSKKEKLKEGIGRNLVKSTIGCAVDGIERVPYEGDEEEAPLKIVPRLHRLVLHGRYGFQDLRKALGNLKDITSSMKSRSSYERKHVKKYPDFNLTIFTHPVNYRPPCQVRVHPQHDIAVSRYKEFLTSLASVLPNLHLSDVEYATDIFCRGPKEVGDLFWVLGRHVYFPYQRKAFSLGGTFDDWGQPSRENRGYRVGKNIIYERGNDKDAVKRDNGKPYWLNEKLDRVRIEHHEVRATKNLLRLEIGNIKDFAREPKFSLIMNPPMEPSSKREKHVLTFKEFDGSKELPKSWEDYQERDTKGNCGFFHLELIRGKGVKGINQYKKDMDAFASFASCLREAWRKFDEEWAGT